MHLIAKAENVICCLALELGPSAKKHSTLIEIQIHLQQMSLLHKYTVLHIYISINDYND